MKAASIFLVAVLAGFILWSVFDFLTLWDAHRRIKKEKGNGVIRRG